ncbi:MAG: tyrosine-type recombinase/integrase [Chitinophagaceae bacterium]
MRKIFTSIYAKHIEDFINLKHTLGFKYEAPQSILRKLDQFAIYHKQKTDHITKEFSDKWSLKMPNESDIYRYTRITILGQFSKYLCSIKIKSHIPKLPPYPSNTFIPYIYSADDIEAIFAASNELGMAEINMGSSIMVMPVLIRILYATGIRIKEALSLQDDDIDIENHSLKIRDSKNGKERMVPITKSLASACKQYRQYKSKLPIKPSPYFFVSLNGRRCGYGSVIFWFRQTLRKAGVHCSDKNLPRIHDLRHTFAVTSLANMAAAGIDLYASLPILSTYLGHQSTDSTNYYVRLTANMYPDLIKELDITCLDVFPKFENYETDEFF